MHTTYLSLHRCAGLVCVGALCLLPAARLLADSKPLPADAFPNFDSYIKISGLAPFNTGDGAAFANRNGTPSAGSGGIEDLYYSKDISDSTNVTVTGRALAGADDYLATFKVTKTDVGTIDTGYKRFRTFYDGVGGFFPQSDTFMAASPEGLHVDRGAFWFEATLARPNAPVFKFSFRDESRNGQKDSTEWAAAINPLAVVVNGALVGTALPANTPFIVPNVQNLDEHHQILEGSMVATLGKTTETFKVTFDRANNNDWRSYVKYPGSTVIVDPTVTVLDDQELYLANTFRVLSKTETKFGEHLALNVGLTYAHTSTAVGGEWDTPAYSSTLKTVYTAVTAGNIYGGSKVDSYVGNAFLKFTPNKNWEASLGFRDENTITTSRGGFITTSLASAATSTASSNFTVAQDLTYSHYDDHVATPEATIQYSGFSSALLYGSYTDRVVRGDQRWINPYAAITTAGITGTVTTATASLGSVFFQDANADNRDVKVGANWTLSRILTFRAEVFHKDHENRFIGSNDYIGTASYGALYVTGYTFTGVKLSAIFKPTAELSFTTRYQPQAGNMTVLANAVTGGTGGEITSGRVRGQMLSETVAWNPKPQIYLQGNLNLVYNYIQTAYPTVVVSTTSSIATPIQNSNNNYVTGSGLCGFVVDKNTDAQLQGYWSRANNYNPGIATGGQPYGAGFEEYTVTLALKHKFSDKWVGTVKGGYYSRSSDTTGDNTNYHGPVAYLAFEHAL